MSIAALGAELGMGETCKLKNDLEMVNVPVISVVELGPCLRRG
jgi:hypothetical protein